MAPPNGPTNPGRRTPDLALLANAEAWVFDLDNTLYPASCNLFAQVDERMRAFISRILDLDPDAAYRLQKQYFRDYGTTLRGLMDRHDLDPTPYLEHVHAIDLSPVAPSPALDEALRRLPGRKIVFTNASADYAGRVLDRLGVSAHFEAVYDIVDADYRPKPVPRVYDDLVARHGLTPQRSVMVEDIARNLAPAAALGMTTVWVRTDSPWSAEGADGGYVDHVTDDLVTWLKAVVAGG